MGSIEVFPVLMPASFPVEYAVTNDVFEAVMTG
jgi:hypothetical protein